MVVALVVIVLGLAGEALLGTLRGTPRTQARAQAEIELLRITSVLQRQIRTVARSLQGASAVAGQNGKELHSDSLTLLTPALLHSAGVGLAEWSIVREGDTPPYLAYRETPYDGGTPVGADTRYPFSRLVRGMEARYYAAPDYVTGWQRAELPERIRITLWYTLDDTEESTSFEAGPGLAIDPSPVPDGGLDVVDDTLRHPSPQPSGSPQPSSSPSGSPSPTSSPSPTPSPSASKAAQP